MPSYTSFFIFNQAKKITDKQAKKKDYQHKYYKKSQSTIADYHAQFILQVYSAYLPSFEVVPL